MIHCVIDVCWVRELLCPVMGVNVSSVRVGKYVADLRESVCVTGAPGLPTLISSLAS